MTATEHPSSDISGVDALADESRGGVPSATLLDESQRPPNEPGISSRDPAPRAGRGPDTIQRVRRTYADQGSGPVRLPDWTMFDIQISLKNLRSWNPAVVQKELRKLRLRWWHLSASKIKEILR